ncbi:MAG: hypothetical protein JOZ45_20500 [Acidobacteriaceae bacterium]|nr:hypothetical protein [Acidobacteriaceae bacterium]
MPIRCRLGAGSSALCQRGVGVGRDLSDALFAQSPPIRPPIDRFETPKKGGRPPIDSEIRSLNAASRSSILNRAAPGAQAFNF